MPVNQLGTVTVPEATLLVISPWDPSVVPLIDKAIRTSDLGLNPTNDGKVVRVPMPSPTEERRKEIVKHLHKVLENHRTAVRNIRRDVKETIDKLEKEKKISQDEQKRALDEMEEDFGGSCADHRNRGFVAGQRQIWSFARRSLAVIFFPSRPAPVSVRPG